MHFLGNWKALKQEGKRNCKKQSNCLFSITVVNLSVLESNVVCAKQNTILLCDLCKHTRTNSMTCISWNPIIRPYPKIVYKFLVHTCSTFWTVSLRCQVIFTATEWSAHQYFVSKVDEKVGLSICTCWPFLHNKFF